MRFRGKRDGGRTSRGGSVLLSLRIVVCADRESIFASLRCADMSSTSVASRFFDVVSTMLKEFDCYSLKSFRSNVLC